MKQITVEELDRVDEATELLHSYSLYVEGHQEEDGVLFILDEESSAVVDLLNQAGIRWSWTPDQYDEDFVEDDDYFDEEEAD